MLALKFVKLDLHFAIHDCLDKLPIRVPKYKSLAEITQEIRKLEGVPEHIIEQEKQREKEKEAEEELSEEAKRKLREEQRRLYLEEKQRREEEERKQFDKELQAMMSTSSSSSSSSNRQGLKMGIPVALLKNMAEVEVGDEGEVVESKDDSKNDHTDKEDENEDSDDDGEDTTGEDEEDEEENDPEFDRANVRMISKPAATAQPANMTFKVLLRKGAKVQARDLSIPEESAIAQKVKERQTAEEREREEMRGLVLQKAKLVLEDDGDNISGNKRLNKTGVNLKKTGNDAPRPVPVGKPVRELGKKF